MQCLMMDAAHLQCCQYLLNMLFVVMLVLSTLGSVIIPTGLIASFWKWFDCSWLQHGLSVVQAHLDTFREVFWGVTG